MYVRIRSEVIIDGQKLPQIELNNIIDGKKALPFKIINSEKWQRSMQHSIVRNKQTNKA